MVLLLMVMDGRHFVSELSNVYIYMFNMFIDNNFVIKIETVLRKIVCVK